MQTHTCLQQYYIVEHIDRNNKTIINVLITIIHAIVWTRSISLSFFAQLMMFESNTRESIQTIEMRDALLYFIANIFISSLRHVNWTVNRPFNWMLSDMRCLSLVILNVKISWNYPILFAWCFKLAYTNYNNEEQPIIEQQNNFKPICG